MSSFSIWELELFYESFITVGNYVLKFTQLKSPSPLAEQFNCFPFQPNLMVYTTF